MKVLSGKTRRHSGDRKLRKTRRGGGWGVSGEVPDIKETHTWGEFRAIVDEFTKYGYDDFLEEHQKLYDEKATLKKGSKRWKLLDDVLEFNLMLMRNACSFECPPQEPPAVVHTHWRGAV